MMTLKKFLLLAATCALLSSSLVGCAREESPPAGVAAGSAAERSSPHARMPDARVLPASSVSVGDATMFRGDIGGKYKIQMRLRREGANLSGTYFYENKRSDINLKGTIDAGGNFVLQEFDGGGQQTGTFKGTWKEADADDVDAAGATLEGHWSKPDGSNSMPFALGEFPVELSAGLNLVSEEIKRDDRKRKVEIDVEYPQIKGATDTRIESFNRLVKSFVTKQVGEFEGEAGPQRETPLTVEMSDSLDIGYSVGVAHNALISVRFGIGTYFRGAAHPNSRTEVVNYDLQSGKRLTLADLFKPSARYLQVIAAYCIEDLKRQTRQHADPEPMLTDESIHQGAAATAENYRSWLITKRGLSITFDAYQVGPYAAGPQFVVVPYSALKEIIKPGSPIAPFVK